MAQSYENVLRGEASGQVCRNLLSAACDALDVHGDDPDSLAILAAGFGAAIHEIDHSVAPGFRRTVADLLTRKYP